MAAQFAVPQPRSWGALPLHGMDRTGLVLAVRDHVGPEAAAAVDRLRVRLNALAGLRAVVAHLDGPAPDLARVLRGLNGPAVVVPLALDTDPGSRGPDVVVTAGLGGSGLIGLALHQRLRDAEDAAGGRADAVVLATAGEPRRGMAEHGLAGNSGVGDGGASVAAGQLRELLAGDAGHPGGVPVVVASCADGSRAVPEAVAALRAAGHRRIAVATHLLTPGRHAAPPTGSGAWAVTAPLADHPLLARVVLRRYAEGCAELA